MKTRVKEFNGKNIDLDKLSNVVEQYFANEKFKTQLGKHPNGTLIQATKEGLLRSIAGMDRAYSINSGLVDITVLNSDSIGRNITTKSTEPSNFSQYFFDARSFI